MTHDELRYAAQREEILDALRHMPRTVSQISAATGFSVYDLRQHCEQMKREGKVNHNWVTGKYST